MYGGDYIECFYLGTLAVSTPIYSKSVSTEFSPIVYVLFLAIPFLLVSHIEYI